LETTWQSSTTRERICSWKRAFELKGFTEQLATGEERDVPNSPDSADPPAVIDRFSWLVEQARKGNSEVLPELRELLDNRPTLWQHYGDLGRLAELAWIQAIVGEDLFLQENVGRRLAQIREDLGIAQASPLEKLLIQRIALNWMRVHHADIAAAQAMTSSNSTKMVQFWQKRLSEAERRYQVSIGALATVRRLLPSSAIRERAGTEKALPAIQTEAEMPACDLMPPLRIVGREP
jgi:hypothetical protein